MLSLSKINKLSNNNGKNIAIHHLPEKTTALPTSFLFYLYIFPLALLFVFQSGSQGNLCDSWLDSPAGSPVSSSRGQPATTQSSSGMIVLYQV